MRIMAGILLMLVGLGVVGYSMFSSLVPQTVVVKNYGYGTFRGHISRLYYEDGTGFYWDLNNECMPMCFYNYTINQKSYIAWTFVKIPIIENIRWAVVENAKFRCSFCRVGGNDNIVVSVYELTENQYTELLNNAQYPKIDNYKLLDNFEINELQYVGDAWSYWGFPVKNYILELDISSSISYDNDIKYIMFASDTNLENEYKIMSFWWNTYGYIEDEWYQFIIEGKTYVKLFGFVYDEKYNPLDNVKIIVENSHYTTSDSGYYELFLLENTPTELTFKKEGYKDVSKVVSLTKNTRMDIVMKKAEEVERKKNLTLLYVGLSIMGVGVIALLVGSKPSIRVR